MKTHATTDFLTEAERALMALSAGVGIACKPCQDFRTDVSFGVEHPCQHCQVMRFLSWRLCAEGEALRVIVDGIECAVLTPPGRWADRAAVRAPRLRLRMRLRSARAGP